MKLILGILFIGIGGYFLSLQAPWWAVLGLAAVVGFLLNQKNIASFWTGFLALDILWGGMALFLHSQNEGIFGDYIGGVFSTNGWGMIAYTALLGGILGGLSSLSGSLFRKLFVKKVEPVQPSVQ